ncbi:MAG: hypothetical protein KME49_21790 [Brasilonema octagenarum HA4186-MV1]|jgi:hypothetical protein|uniref:Uncharacterized protein n=1 Tax=Brasilonema octagenarum UFV-OR1 TaxID=417115 RepID=A0ABX1M5L4_9CYAN|nr:MULTISPECIES: hypothetical protein [Brasilonema]MBW4628068.1 hypothetical protein [Brasilonema octagenarum HA4186-MV1]NMF62991.1 hypothetical protein [Brasilonema octagenarum UFV-OR1]
MDTGVQITFLPYTSTGTIPCARTADPEAQSHPPLHHTLLGANVKEQTQKEWQRMFHKLRHFVHEALSSIRGKA